MVCLLINWKLRFRKTFSSHHMVFQLSLFLTLLWVPGAPCVFYSAQYELCYINFSLGVFFSSARYDYVLFRKLSVFWYLPIIIFLLRICLCVALRNQDPLGLRGEWWWHWWQTEYDTVGWWGLWWASSHVLCWLSCYFLALSNYCHMRILSSCDKTFHFFFAEKSKI